MRYMRKFTQWLYMVGVAALLAGCFTPDVDDGIVINGQQEKPNAMLSDQMNPSFAGTEATLPKYAADRMSTRSLVDQESTVKLQANFLRIDEDKSLDDSRGLYTFNPNPANFTGLVNWNTADLLEATLMSSPDNSPERLRSVFLDPTQTYNIRVQVTDLGGGEILKDTTDFYHTRMVSWYPMNCKVPRNDKGTAAKVKFSENYYDAVRINEKRDVDGDGNAEDVVAIQFRGLDGSVDVMVSDVREGQHWHFNDGVHRSDFMPDDDSKTGVSIYSEPFGHFSQEGIPGVQREINYRNFFTYNHYLSAVRIFAYADQSPQNLSMWGDLESVTISNQPTSVKVWLPSEEGVWGEAYDWDDLDNIQTVGTPIYGTYDTSGDLPETVTFPVSIKGTSSANEQYLGYALVQPNRDVEIQVHTTSGIYSVVVPHIYTNSGGVDDDIFQAGCIYDIHLNLETSGTIAALLQKEADDVFYDLTRLETYVSPEDEGETILETYKYANCYICSPAHTTYTDKYGVEQFYDGFCFSATTIGNGAAGIISQGAQTLYPTSAGIKPTSARLLWESELGLVTQVELIYGYVRFKTPEDKNRKGNAVIAVYDDDDNVLWSWHIWITDPVSDQTYENGNNDIVMMDRNLGAMAATWDNGDPASVLPTYGLYYQWGRKDPSMGPLTYDYYPINLITAPYYDYSSRECNAAEVVLLPQPTLKDAVENPMFLILPTSKSGGYNYDWLYNRYDFLWGYNEAQSDKISKTIYDPCPWGYRVPLNEMEIIFGDGAGSVFDTPNTTSLGQTFTDSKGTKFWFPYAGYKGVDKGLNSLSLAWNYVGEKGDYMSASVESSAGNAQYHRSRVYLHNTPTHHETTGLDYTGYRVLDHTNRRTAASIRCVKNDVMGSLMIDLVPSEMVYDYGDNLTIAMSARAAESCITHALLTVTSDDTGVTRTVYEGYPNSNAPTWSHVADYVISTGGEFWSESYTFTLIVDNDMGARKSKSVTIYYHPNFNDLQSIDLSLWEAADDAKIRLFAWREFTRRFVVNTEVGESAPTDVKVTYVDSGNTVVEDATLISSEGGKHTYEVSFFVTTVGQVEFEVEATCANAPGHKVKQTISTTYVFENGYFYPSTADTGWAGYAWAYCDTDDIGFDWSINSNSGNIASVTFSTETHGVIATINPESTSKASGHFVFDSEYVAADADGRFTASIRAVSEGGNEIYNTSHTLFVYHPVYDSWDGNEVSVVLLGGRDPESVALTINGTTYALNKDNTYVDTTGSNRISKTRWTTTLGLATGTYDGTLSVTVNDGHRNHFTTQTPTLTIAGGGGGGGETPDVTINGIGLKRITDVAEIVAGEEYVFANRAADTKYAYDNGNGVGMTETLTNAAFFTITGTTDNWLLMSTNEQDYATFSYSTLSCSQTNAGSAQKWVVEENESDYFWIYGINGYSFYWNIQNKNSTTVTTTSSGESNNTHQWIIYKVIE